MTETTNPVPQTLQQQLAALLATTDVGTLVAELAKNAKAADIKAALKKAEDAKPTLLSVTMDAIVSHVVNGEMTTDAISKTVTERGIALGVVDAGKSATQSSVAALMRYADAFTKAMQRAGFDWSKTETEQPAPDASAEAQTGETETSAPAPDADPATSAAPKNANRRSA